MIEQVFATTGKCWKRRSRRLAWIDRTRLIGILLAEAGHYEYPENLIMNFQNWPKVPTWRAQLLAGIGVCIAVSMLAFTHVEAHAESTKVTSKTRKPPSQSRVELKSQANQMASGIRAAQAALSPDELAIAQRIEVGRIPCELGAFVTVEADLLAPGYFDISGKKFKFRMTPVVTSTGAIRLEDAAAGAVWLQLSNKSMLMNHKTGSRMADECRTQAQVAVADAMLKNPPLSLLEPLPVALSPAPNAAVLDPVVSGMAH